MRLGVLDVGSNTVHLLVVDAHWGACPLPAYSHKTELRLAELLEKDGSLSPSGVRRLETVIADALQVAEDKGVQELLAFATSAVRDAPNGEAVLARIREDTGADLKVLSGADEARLTFLAVRRWFGWSSGRLLVLDIGGGSLEIACGVDENPDVAFSLPLGAGRLTRDWLPDDPPKGSHVRALRKHVRAEIAGRVGDVTRFGTPNHVVATSKTFRQMARLAGAAPSAEGLHVRRELAHADLMGWLPKLTEMPSTERAQLPGISEGRARQVLAGAIVADATMDLLGVAKLEVCPWALREGMILDRLDRMTFGELEASLPPAQPDGGDPDDDAARDRASI